MLGIPKSGALPRPQILQVALLGVLIAAVVYLTFFSPTGNVVDPTGGPPRPIVEAPTLSAEIMALAKDNTREQRLVLEPEPFAHLLSTSLNVVPSMAESLHMPAKPVAVAELRANRDSWRGRWLWYKGKLERLDGPKPGHPVAGRSIYEATVQLNDGETVLFVFSAPPDDKVHRGGFVRIAGYLMKLRDTTFPTELQEAPLLVGKSIERDYDDWGPVTELDRSKLAIEDGSWREGVDGGPGSFEPGPLAWLDIEDDQSYPLWHLAAYVRGQRGKLSHEEWRKFPALNGGKLWDEIKLGEVDRGTPLRLLGTLVKLDTYAAHANPAGIEYWTVAWVSVHDLKGGKTVPVWIPERVEPLQLGTGLEVRGYYYRRFVYQGRRNDLWFTPLLVADGLDAYDWNPSEQTWQLTAGMTIGGAALILFTWWSHRRFRRSSQQHEAVLAERRRRRRARMAASPPAQAT